MYWWSQSFASQVESTFFSPLQLPSQTFSTQFLEKTSRKIVSMFGNCFYPPPPPLKNNNNKNNNNKNFKARFQAWLTSSPQAWAHCWVLCLGHVFQLSLLPLFHTWSQQDLCPSYPVPAELPVSLTRLCRKSYDWMLILQKPVQISIKGSDLF